MLERMKDIAIGYAGKGPVLRIDGGSAAAIADNTNAFRYFIKGLSYNKAAAANIDLASATICPTGAGEVIQDDYECAFSVWIDADGDYLVEKGEEYSITRNLKLSDIPYLSSGKEGYAFVGVILIKNETATNFTIGTTNLDASGATTLFFDAQDIPLF